MARKAFIIASNGPEAYRLKYAEKDAESFAKCLQSIRYGFEVIWPKKKTKSQIIEEFEDTILSCGEDDSLICYFSGHGHLPKGKLHLVVEENDDLDKASLRFSNLAQDLDEKCKAKNKLVILDCCHAGAADMKDIPPKYEDVIPENNYVVIAASDRLSTIREYLDLEGSFLTQKICEALDAEFYEVDKDKDDRITLDDLITWLKDSNFKYNLNKKPKERAPVPYLKNGHLKGSFYLTQETFPWSPQYLSTPTNIELVVLPIKPKDGWVVCISKHPVTNSEYKIFVEQTKRSKPRGRFIPFGKAGSPQNWKEGFQPWKNENFNDPHQPVVCVSFEDAKAYCDWVNNTLPETFGRIFLPPMPLWNFAAYGVETFSNDFVNQKKWSLQNIHHKTFKPALTDKTSLRTNHFGISDLFGNIWEWSPGERTIEDFCVMKSVYINPPYLLGGGFLDDFSAKWFKPNLRSAVVKPSNPFKFRSFDLGFRTAHIVTLTSISPTTQERLLLCSPRSEEFWEVIFNNCYL